MNTNLMNFLINSALDNPLDKFDSMDLASTDLSPQDLQALASNNSLELRDYVIGPTTQPNAFNSADLLIPPNSNKEFLAADLLIPPKTCD